MCNKYRQPQHHFSSSIVNLHLERLGCGGKMEDFLRVNGRPIVLMARNLEE